MLNTRKAGFKGFASDWWSHAPTEAFFFSLIGPAKFIKGGTTANQAGRLGSIFKNRFHARNSKINNMTNEQLRTRIHAIDALSGGGLNLFKLLNVDIIIFFSSLII